VRAHRVRVEPLPAWLDVARLLGDGDWELTDNGGWVLAVAELGAEQAADVQARLRGVVLAGRAIECEVVPRVARPLVRRARLAEARRQRDRSVGFARPGTVLDEEMRIGLTSESLSLAIGERASRMLEQRFGKAPADAPHTVLDACCGAGGNAIGFARCGLRVIAIDIDATRVEAARRNARVYGVSEYITFLQGDARELASAHEAALWFVDVPWALRDSQGGLPLLTELVELRARGQALWAKVPADFDPLRVPGAEPSGWFGSGTGDARRVKLVLLEL